MTDRMPSTNSGPSTVRPRSVAGRGLTRPGAGERRTTTAITTASPDRPAADLTQETSEPILYTADQAAKLLQVRPSWLRRKATARAVPCRFVGKHLRFSRADIDAIADASAQPPRQSRHTTRAV
jgi:excisionase family DNA binding protein